MGVVAAGLALLAAALMAAAAAPLHVFASVAVLVGLFSLNLVLLGLRLLDLWCAVRRIERRDPERRGRRRRCRRVTPTTRRLALAVAGTISLAHAAVAAELELARSTLIDVFPTASRPVEAPGAPVEASRTNRVPTPAREPLDSQVSAARGGALAPPDGSFDILMVGLDAGAGRQGARNDANMVVRVDPATAEVLLVGVPRNLVQLPMPSTGDACGCFRSPLYALYGHGLDHADHWPGELDAGAAAVRDSLEPLLGMTIEGYVVADMGAFVDLVNAVGGVEVVFTGGLVDDKSDPFEPGRRIHLDVDPGLHHLDGSQALTLARSRRTDDDYARMQRQRCLVHALSAPASDLGPADVLRLSRSVRGRLVSDIPRADLAELITLVQRVQRDAIASLGLVPPAFTHGYDQGYPLADVDRMQAAMRAWRDDDGPSATVGACL